MGRIFNEAVERNICNTPHKLLMLQGSPESAFRVLNGFQLRLNERQLRPHLAEVPPHLKRDMNAGAGNVSR